MPLTLHSPGRPKDALQGRVLRKDSPFRAGRAATLSDLELITAAWVHWYNTSRLMHRPGRRPLPEVEAEYFDQQTNEQLVVHR